MKFVDGHPGGAMVHKKAANVENAVSDFWHAGIFPWDPTKVRDKKLAQSHFP